MSFSDLLIIYLACGAPFAVYRSSKLTDLGGRRTDYISILVDLFFWPIIAIWELFRSNSKTAQERNSGFETLRIELEQLAFAEAPTSTVFEFRDLWHRYIGLSEASSQGMLSRPAEIFVVEGHPNSHLASLCLARSNARKLNTHLDQARNQLAAVITNAVEMGAEPAPVVESLVELAQELNDPIGIRAFAALGSAIDPLMERQLLRTSTQTVAERK